MNTKAEKLSDSLTKLATSLERQTRVLEILIEGMKPSTEARILGVSVSTVTRRRKARRMEKLLT